jgi:hypothetical protein
MSSKEEEQDYLPIIDYRFPNLKYDQDKFSRDCPLLAIPDRERQWTISTHEEITYLDYTYCKNETRLPVLRTRHSARILYRVSFYMEVRVICTDLWGNDPYSEQGWQHESLEDEYLTEVPISGFTFTATIQRGTFPIDHFVFNGLEVPASEYKKKEWTENDPRYFKEVPTEEEWNKKIKAPVITHKYTFKEVRPSREEISAGGLLHYNNGYFGVRPFTRTIETFLGINRISKVKKVVNGRKKSYREFKLRRDLCKRAPTWVLESAFDTTLNPFIHVEIYYYLVSIWFEPPRRKL